MCIKRLLKYLTFLVIIFSNVICSLVQAANSNLLDVTTVTQIKYENFMRNQVFNNGEFLRQLGLNFNHNEFILSHVANLEKKLVSEKQVDDVIAKFHVTKSFLLAHKAPRSIMHPYGARGFIVGGSLIVIGGLLLALPSFAKYVDFSESAYSCSFEGMKCSGYCFMASGALVVARSRFQLTSMLALQSAIEPAVYYLQYLETKNSRLNLLHQRHSLPPENPPPKK